MNAKTQNWGWKPIAGMAGLVLASIASASSGVLEINQACALNGGCFPGDTAGFPVTISGNAGKSYQLTGDLDLTAHPTATAIEITGSFVTFDLAGFEIAGPTVCTGDIGFDFECLPINPGAYGIRLTGNVVAVTIHSGTIRGMGIGGIQGTSDVLSRVENITVSNNGGLGVALNDQSMVNKVSAHRNALQGIWLMNRGLISHSFAIQNGGHGFNTGEDSTVEYCSTAGNGGRAFELGPKSNFLNNHGQSSQSNQQNLCGGGICTEQKRYYLTQAFKNASEATTACANGFHMAALFEIRDTSSWRYDEVLGFTNGDSGSGPPNGHSGWVRTGGFTSSSGNCNGWTSDANPDTGVVARLPLPSMWVTTAETTAPLRTTLNVTCTAPQRVWCAED